MNRARMVGRVGIPLLALAGAAWLAAPRAGLGQSSGVSIQDTGGGPTAFQVNLNVTLVSSANNASATANIPAARRFVIERVGLTGTQPANQALFYRLVTTVNGTQSTYPLIGVVTSTSSTLNQVQVGFNQRMDGLYADHPLRFTVTRASTNGPANLTLAVSGHLEP